jgi:hypothetical protein
MKHLTRMISIFCALMFAGYARAGDSPTPRPPIGPKVLEMLPPETDSIAKDRVRITNIGNQQLHIAYWDGDGVWKSQDIDAGQPKEILCSKCGGAITVAYHNGKETKQIKLTSGGTYVLGWSDQSGTWMITSGASQ